MTVTIDGTNGITTAGNITFPDTGQRITGDFSNATVANRVAFQTSTTNSATSVYILPNGTSTTSQFVAAANSDPTNTSVLQLQANSTDYRIVGGITGTGTYLPMTFYTGGSERMRVDTSGNVLVTNPAGLGYGTGSGGTVTQATSKSTGVTLNKPTGSITMNNAALAAGASVTFTLTNSLIGYNDMVLTTHNASGGTSGAYVTQGITSGNGSAVIRVTNISAGSLSETVNVNFAIIKGAAS